MASAEPILPFLLLQGRPHRSAALPQRQQAVRWLPRLHRVATATTTVLEAVMPAVTGRLTARLKQPATTLRLRLVVGTRSVRTMLRSAELLPGDS